MLGQSTYVELFSRWVGFPCLDDEVDELSIVGSGHEKKKFKIWGRDGEVEEKRIKRGKSIESRIEGKV